MHQIGMIEEKARCRSDKNGNDRYHVRGNSRVPQHPGDTKPDGAIKYPVDVVFRFYRLQRSLVFFIQLTHYLVYL